MIFEAAQKAFDTKLYQFGIDNNIAVALENVDAPTDTSIPFVSGFMLDSTLTSSSLAVSEELSFLYQIDVRYETHLGSAPINKMIDKLRQLFYISSYHYWDNECFGVNDLSVSGLRVDAGWSVKSITLTCNSYTPVLS